MIENLINSAHFLFEKKRFTESAYILNICKDYITDDYQLDKVYKNMKMCYFLANNVPEAFKILELQEKLNVNVNWELKRDKSNFLRYLNRYDEAYNTALEISDDRTRYLALSWFLHKQGKIKESFEMIEKSRKDSYWWKQEPKYDYDLWKGQNVDNIVVIAESGFGDEIIFSRWIPQLKTFSKKIYYDGKGLESVFCRNFQIENIQNIQNVSDIFLVPIMSLPYLLQIDKIEPRHYLICDANIKQKYNEKYTKKQNKRIGLCVQGEKTHVETTLRTLPLQKMVDVLEPFGEIVNLQKEIDIRDNRIRYIPFSTWEDTFALIDTCDVIVTCDTSIAHAAGALGKKTIVLMHAAAYFTWNHNQDMSKTDWYENGWCIHQDIPCNWDNSITKCVNLLNQIL